jgi:uncharacterized protein YdaU (DUF1376 family)
MNEFPWFRFFPQDWLAGTSDLSAAERGVYITLLAVIYDRGGPIPRNDVSLGRRCGLPKAGFVRALESLIEAGKLTLNDGMISNERAEIELVERAKHSATQAKRAQSRWQKTKEKQQSENAAAMPEACQSQSHTHTQSLSSKENTRKARVLADQDQAFIDECWTAIPKRRGDARKPFVQALTKALRNGADREAIRRGIAAYAASEAGSSGEYRKGAAVWINNECWTADWSEPRGSPPAQQSSRDGAANLYHRLREREYERRNREENHSANENVLALPVVQGGQPEDGSDDGRLLGGLGRLFG